MTAAVGWQPGSDIPHSACSNENIENVENIMLSQEYKLKKRH